MDEKRKIRKGYRDLTSGLNCKCCKGLKVSHKKPGCVEGAHSNTTFLTPHAPPQTADRARDPDNITATSLRTRIQTANRFFDQVKNPAEAVLDSTFLSTVGDLALQEARKLKVGGDYFDTDDFVASLKLVVMGGPAAGASQRRNGTQRRRGRGRGAVDSDDEEVDDDDDDDDDIAAQNPVKGWDIVGAIATRHTLRVPPIDFMYGS